MKKIPTCGFHPKKPYLRTFVRKAEIFPSRLIGFAVSWYNGLASVVTGWIVDICNSVWRLAIEAGFDTECCPQETCLVNGFEENPSTLPKNRERHAHKILNDTLATENFIVLQTNDQVASWWNWSFKVVFNYVVLCCVLFYWVVQCFMLSVASRRIAK